MPHKEVGVQGWQGLSLGQLTPRPLALFFSKGPTLHLALYYVPMLQQLVVMHQTLVQVRNDQALVKSQWLWGVSFRHESKSVRRNAAGP